MPAALSPDRWRVVSPYLDRALELEGDERDAFLTALRAEDASLAADLGRLLDSHQALSEQRFLDEALLRATPARLAGRPGPGRLHAAVTDRAGRHGQRLAGGAQRRPLPRPGGREAPEREPGGPRRRGALPPRGQHPGPAAASAHRAPHRRGRLAAGPAVPASWSTWTASASTPTATRAASPWRRASDSSWTCWPPSRTRTRTWSCIATSSRRTSWWAPTAR